MSEEETGGLLADPTFQLNLLLWMHQQLPTAGSPTSPKGDSLKDGECIVCLDAPRTHLMHPCGHLSMCERCAGTLMASVLPKCAVCRKDVDSIVKVYK